jgi:hypothetical protein
MNHQSCSHKPFITALITSVLVCTAFLTIDKVAESYFEESAVTAIDDEIAVKKYRERRSSQR